MIRLTVLFAAALLLASFGSAAEKAPDALGALERKLHGTWDGTGPCDGDLVLRADGTYARKHFSPGNNELTGTWKVRWDALPPTLVLHCETADRAYFVGKTTKVKLLELTEESFTYQYPHERKTRYERVKP